MSKHLTTIARAAAAVALCLGLAACGQAGTTSAPDRGITVSATSRVSVVPDTCSFTVSVVTQGSSAKAAQKANAKPVSAVIERLKELGVPEESIRTQYMDVSPLWDENGQTDTYESRTILEVSDVSIDEAGSLIDAALDAGATEAGSLDYTTTSYETAYEEALAQAVEATRGKAETIAEASGVRLGDIVQVNEGYQDLGLYAKEEVAMASADMDDTGMGTELAPGEVEVQAEVSVTYAIN